ncbi:MAG: GAF domain-containing sensor histidine kinase [Haloferacaceae archaeon]
MSERRYLADLHDATRRLIEADSESEILSVAASTIDEVLGVGPNVVRKADRESGTFPIVATSGTTRSVVGDPPEYAFDDDSPVARAFRTGTPISLEDDAAVRDPFSAALYVPLGEYGVFVVGRRTGGFPREDVERVELLAETITAALERTARERTLRELHEASRRLTRAESRTEICEIAIQTGSALLGFAMSSVLLYDETTGLLEPVETTEAVTELLSDPPSVEPGEGIIGRAYETGEPERHGDVTEVPAVLNPETPIRSELVVPLGEHGVLVLDSPEAGAMDDTDQLLARILAANVEAALDRHERDEQVQAYVREIERKNDRLETFASVLSHDLRNPLNIARGYLDIVREEHDIEELETVAEAHERIDSLIADVLTLARQGQDLGELETVPLARAAERSWSSIETDDVELVLEDLPTIRADESRLRQVLENLFRNAVEHGTTGDRGATSTGAAEGGDDAGRGDADGDDDTGEADDNGVTVTVGALDSGFYVADDGPGLPPSIRDGLFDADGTLNGGSGLGLQIVQTIVNAHGWEIEATESEAGGARFEITGVALASECGRAGQGDGASG